MRKLLPYLPSNVMYIKLGKNPEHVLVSLSLPQIFTELSKRCSSLQILIVDNATLSHSVETSLDSIASDAVKDEAYLENNCLKEVYLTMQILRNVLLDEIHKYPALKNLKVLSVRRILFDSLHFFANVDASVLPQLEVLDLTGSFCVFPTTPITLSGLSNLQELYLGGSGIENGVLQQMKSSLKQMKVLDLEGLCYENNELFDIIKDSHCLEKLYVGYSHLVNDTFLSRMKRNVFPHLKVLCLRYTGVSSGGVKELAKSWGSLKLTNVFHERPLFDTVNFCDHFLENHCNYD